MARNEQQKTTMKPGVLAPRAHSRTQGPQGPLNSQCTNIHIAWCIVVFYLTFHQYTAAYINPPTPVSLSEHLKMIYFGRIGVNGFENPMRDSKVTEFKSQVQIYPSIYIPTKCISIIIIVVNDHHHQQHNHNRDSKVTEFKSQVQICPSINSNPLQAHLNIYTISSSSTT